MIYESALGDKKGSIATGKYRLLRGPELQVRRFSYRAKRTDVRTYIK